MGRTSLVRTWSMCEYTTPARDGTDFFKGAVSRYPVIFCAFFAWGKNGDCLRKCRGHQTMTAWWAARTASLPEKMSFSSSNCRFPRPCLVAAIIFSHTKWLPKITDYRDTAALNLPFTVPAFSCHMVVMTENLCPGGFAQCWTTTW